MNLPKLLVYIAFVFGPFAVLAQYKPSADTLLDHMAGKWLLKGNIAGSREEHDITAAWVLGHQYIQLKETSRGKKIDGKPAYDAIIFISRDTVKNQYDCLWLDNTSNSGLANEIIAHAPVKPGELAFLFKFSNTSCFHTTLTYSAAADSWQWLLTDDEHGEIKVFADAVMIKTP